MTRALTLALTLAACSPDGGLDGFDQPFELRFSATVHGKEVACGDTFSIGSPPTDVQLADARIYISNLSFQASDGAWTAALLDQDGVWQHGEVALLDFEDGTAACADSGNAQTRQVIAGALPEGNWTAVRFDVGLPAEQNHIDSATAPSPLDTLAMFWVWQTGYKFARFDFSIEGGPPTRWNNHFGSTGCTSPAPTIAPNEPCDRQNRATITLTDFHPVTDLIHLDLPALVAGVDPTQNTPETPPGCLSGPNEPEDCLAPFAALGLDFASGKCIDDCADQTLFIAHPE